MSVIYRVKSHAVYIRLYIFKYNTNFFYYGAIYRACETMISDFLLRYKAWISNGNH